MTGVLPPALLKGGQQGGGAFHNRITGNFMVYHDRFQTNLLQLFENPKNSEWFSVISAIIWGQHCCCAKASIIANDFFIFYKFPLPSTLLLPLPLALPLFLASLTKTSKYPKENGLEAFLVWTSSNKTILIYTYGGRMEPHSPPHFYFWRDLTRHF